MHRNRTWQLDPTELRTQRNRILPIEGGDGSTLSLDFTTGVLDPRLSFTRGSDATFVNSSGFVQYADTNLVRNSIFSGGNTPDQWSLPSGHAGLTTPADGVRRAVTTTAAQNFINSASMTASVGRVYAVTVNIREVSGQHYRNTIEVTNSPTYVKYYRNGTEVSSGSGEFITAQSGLITLVWVATSATGHLLRIGVGCTGANVADAVCEFERPHVTAVFYPSTTAGVGPSTFTAPAYVPNASLTGPYFAPRFDYDPSTLAPRGLLVEGQATNLLYASETFNNTTYWGGSGYTFGTGATAPNGATASQRLTVSSASAPCNAQQSSVLSATSCTFSVWWKNGNHTASTNTALRTVAVRNNTTATILLNFNFHPTTLAITYVTGSTGALVVPYPDGWYRISATVTSGITPGNTIGCYLGGIGSTVTGESGTYSDWWGAQLEAGSGASSYIPTVASQVTRNRDELTLTNLSSIAFSQTSGTAFAHVEVREKATGAFTPYGSFDTSGGGRCWWWMRHNLDASVGTRLLGNAFNSAGATAITTSNYQYNSGNGGLVKFATSLDTAASAVVYVIGGGSPQTTTASAFTLATAAQWSVNVNSDVGATTLGSMWMRSFKYWPTNLPNATLQSLTT